MPKNKPWPERQATDVVSNPDSAVAPPESEDELLTAKILAGRDVSASTFQREFELDDVLDYVKTGIASIIEDEVTQRFVSEELKVPLLHLQISPCIGSLFCKSQKKTHSKTPRKFEIFG